MKNKVIITIGRQFGSGGREIGKKLADRLQIPFYDKELIEMTAKESGMSEVGYFAFHYMVSPSPLQRMPAIYAVTIPLTL